MQLDWLLVALGIFLALPLQHWNYRNIVTMSGLGCGYKGITFKSPGWKDGPAVKIMSYSTTEPFPCTSLGDFQVGRLSFNPHHQPQLDFRQRLYHWALYRFHVGTLIQSYTHGPLLPFILRQGPIKLPKIDLKFI